jgi:hypothetical protein
MSSPVTLPTSIPRHALEAKCAHHEWERDYWYRKLQELIDLGADLYALVDGDDELAVDARRAWLEAVHRLRRGKSGV